MQVSSARTAGEGFAGKPYGEAVHATAVAIGEACVLILGPSGAGKSRLAATLIAASTPRQPICLVGDDRTLLMWRRGILRARPHPRIAGFLERRGLGIVAYPFAADVGVAGIVRLDSPPAAGLTTVSTSGGQNFFDLPTVVITRQTPVEAQCDAVLAWWRDACTTLGAKATRDPPRPAKV